MKGLTLTIKQQRLVQGVIQGKSQTQSAIDAGYSSRSASAIASKTLRNVNIQEYIIFSLESAGLTAEDVVKPLADSLKAVKFDRHGNEQPDHNIRLKSVDIILKILGV